MQPTLEEKQKEHLKLLLEMNHKIEAIKYLMEHSNLGLKDAKEYIENQTLPQGNKICLNVNDSIQSVITNSVTQQVLIKYTNGQKIKINEQHAEWPNAMKFLNKNVHSTKKELFNNFHSSTTEPLHNSSQPMTTSSLSESTATSGIQDLTKNKTSMKLIVLLIFFILIGSFLYFYLN